MPGFAGSHSDKFLLTRSACSGARRGFFDLRAGSAIAAGLSATAKWPESLSESIAYAACENGDLPNLHWPSTRSSRE